MLCVQIYTFKLEINIEDVTNSSVEERCENVEGGGDKKDEIQYTVFIFM